MKNRLSLSLSLSRMLDGHTTHACTHNDKRARHKGHCQRQGQGAAPSRSRKNEQKGRSQAAAQEKEEAMSDGPRVPGPLRFFLSMQTMSVSPERLRL